MCRCTPNIRTPFCGKPGCTWPKPEGVRPLEGIPLTQVNGLWTNGHLRFDPIVPSIWPPRPGWDIRLASSKVDAEPVGRIRWHGLWREFVFRTTEGYVFAQDCLSDITQFCRDRNGDHKDNKQPGDPVPGLRTHRG